MPSPYFISIDPSPTKLRMFFGRRSEIRAIIDYLQNGESVLLIGERRIGKTFLLYMISDSAGLGADFYGELLDRNTRDILAELRCVTSSYRWVFVDMLSITTTSGFYFNILARLSEEQAERFIASPSLDHTSFANELIKLSKDLSCTGQRAVVLVDESEKLFDLEESACIFSCLKAAIQQCDAVEFVLAGDIKPHQITPEFVNLKSVLRHIYLPPLDPADANALIQLPVERHLSFEDSALQRIFELTGGKPSLVQILCGHLYEIVKLDESKKICLTLAEIDHLWESGLRDRVFESFEVALKDFFEGLQGTEQSIFCFLAHNPLSTPDDIVKLLGVQHTLIQRGIYTLQKTHRIETVGSGFRICARIIEEYGARFVPCPTAEWSQPTPLAITQDDRQESALKTNLMHHSEGIAALVEQWEGIKSQQEIESWLLMFEDDERDLAIKLLGNTKYYRQREIDRFCKILHGKFLRATGHSLKTIWLFGMGGPSKSGHMLLYHYRAVNGLSESHFQDHRMFSAFAAKGIRVLAFIDDFIGSGNQVTTFWHDELENRRGIEKADLYCLVLFAFRSGVERVQAQTPFKVICVELLDERDRVFSPECAIFKDDEERKLAEQICRRHGEVLCPQHPLGYDDSQALIAFEYQTPNNSLPILWSNAKGWIPIFERKS